MKEKKWCAASVCSDLLILTSLHVRSTEETVHSKPTWFHEFILMKGITHFFLITSHFASRLWLLHRKNSIFQLTCTYLSTVNRKIHGVQHVSWLQGHRRAGKRRGHCPLSFRRGGNVGGGTFLGNFMVYQDRFETNLLQLFAQQHENSECFSMISAIICEVNILAEEKKTYFVFLQVSIALNFFYCRPCSVVLTSPWLTHLAYGWLLPYYFQFHLLRDLKYDKTS